jgi:tRNA threonylcarbamoyladenosine biosynthesis protein TsaE
MEWIIQSPEELPALMPAFLEALGERRKIALFGDMGAGKTTFVKALCTQLGVQDNTSSPTFSLVNEYHYLASDGTEALLHHLDLYRLRSPQEAYDIGLDELMHDPWLCLVEWPQVAEAFFPENAARVEIEMLGESTRRITLK